MLILIYKLKKEGDKYLLKITKNRLNKNFSAQAFTIVELLVVIVVIGILAAITIISYTGVLQKSRDSVRLSDISNVRKVLELYHAENGFYPSVGFDGGGYILSTLATPLAAYINSIPTDPSSPSRNYSYVRGPGDAYGILINYESKPQCKTGVNINAGWWGAGVPSC